MQAKEGAANQKAGKADSNVDSLIALLSIACIALYLILIWSPYSGYASYPLYLALGVGGGILVFDLAAKLLHFRFDSDLLAGLSIITSVLLQEYLAGSLVVLMLSGGRTIESYAVRSASKMLDVLAKRAPTKAHLKKDSGLQDITLDKIKVGDILTILPHEICPVDGVVMQGKGVMDESYLTGEPYLISKTVGSTVLSGAINGNDSLTIRAGKLAQDSRYARIMEVISESEQKRPHMRRLADQLGAWYTPLALIIALSAWVYSGDSIRFLAVLVIATPCPLLIAIPVAIIGTISLSAKRGILIKNPIVLEQVDYCKTIIFDKTGTLTYGTPHLTEITTFSGFMQDEVLRLVASLERYSKHPLAGAITEEAAARKITPGDPKEISEPKGQGMTGMVDNHVVVITSRKSLAKYGLSNQITLLPAGEGLECVVLVDGELAAHFSFRDIPRSDSTLFIRHLAKHGLTKAMIVSGDREEAVKYLASQVGIQEIYGGKSPEEKVEIVEEETKKAKTIYVGDGINDAPALAVSTVGIAFGKNSDITAEAAGVVVMDNTMEKIDEFLHISTRMRKIALQSALGGMFLSIIGMLIAFFGYLPPVSGAISQELIDIAAILNSLRTILKPKVITDF